MGKIAKIKKMFNGQEISLLEIPREINVKIVQKQIKRLKINIIRKELHQSIQQKNNENKTRHRNTYVNLIEYILYKLNSVTTIYKFSYITMIPKVKFMLVHKTI